MNEKILVFGDSNFMFEKVQDCRGRMKCNLGYGL